MYDQHGQNIKPKSAGELQPSCPLIHKRIAHPCGAFHRVGNSLYFSHDKTGECFPCPFCSALQEIIMDMGLTRNRKRGMAA